MWLIIPDELEGTNLTQDAARVAYTTQTHGQWLLYTLKASVTFAQLDAADSWCDDSRGQHT